MANITSFSVQSPYDQQMEELKRRQRMAELMQQEAMQPLESQVAPGGMVVPTSPVLGLAKLLQGYMSGKQLRDIEKQRGEAEQGARTEALDFLRSFSPERKTIGMGEAFGAGLPIPQISDKGQVSYQAPSVTAMPNARPVGSLDQPMQMQVGGPLGRRDQLARAEEGMFSSNPLVRALAQTKYEAASRPVNLMDYMDKPKLDTATPESVRAYTESIAQGAPDPSVLRFQKPEEPSSEIKQYNLAKKEGFKGNFVDFQTALRRAGATTVTTSYGAPVSGVDEQGNPVFFQPDRAGGTPAIIPGVRPEAKAPTKEQADAAGFAERLKAADETLSKIPFKPTINTAIRSDLPFSNKWMSEQQQMFEQAKREFITAQLRRESGAVIGASEFKDADLQYFPQPNDKPGTVLQKAKSRKRAIQNMLRSAGPAADTVRSIGATPAWQPPPDLQTLINQYVPPGER